MTGFEGSYFEMISGEKDLSFLALSFEGAFFPLKSGDLWVD